MSIVIGCDSFLSLRNVRNGDLGRRLANHRVLVWVDPLQLKGSCMAQPDGIELGPLEEFDAHKNERLARLLRRAYLARKSYYDPATIWVDLKQGSHRHNRNNRLRRAASMGRAAAALGGYWVAGRAGLAQVWRTQFADKLCGHSIVQVYRQRLQEVGTKLVAGFSPEGNREMALIEAARTLGLPTVLMIRSRDNLSAKIPHLPEADAYFVWSDITRSFFLHMYPEVNPDHVIVTGSPQFDRHLDPAYRLKREAFFSLMGLDPNRPLIVYTMATPGLDDHEIEIAQHLADAAHAGRFSGRAQLLVRGHPRMFGSNIKLLHQEYPEARSYPQPTKAAYRSPEHEAQVVQLILEDEPVHLATLAYQDVQVNVCGTMTIDSAILDKPTVNVCYDLVEGLPPGLSVRRYYKRSDVRQMMSYGASRLARDPDECIRLINLYLEDPTLDAEGRKRAREQDCGPLDGQAGKRIADAIGQLAGQEAKWVA